MAGKCVWAYIEQPSSLCSAMSSTHSLFLHMIHSSSPLFEVAKQPTRQLSNPLLIIPHSQQEGTLAQANGYLLVSEC